jgi:hypothetical protein
MSEATKSNATYDGQTKSSWWVAEIPTNLSELLASWKSDNTKMPKIIRNFYVKKDNKYVINTIHTRLSQICQLLPNSKIEPIKKTDDSINEIFCTNHPQHNDDSKSDDESLQFTVDKLCLELAKHYPTKECCEINGLKSDDDIYWHCANQTLKQFPHLAKSLTKSNLRNFWCKTMNAWRSLTKPS